MAETSRADEELIIKARKRFKTLWESETYLRDSFERGMEFSFNIGEGHWSAEAKKERAGDETKPARPYLTANLFSKFVAKVVNMERGFPDRDLVIPVDGDADPKTADIYNKIIEDIEYHSDYDQITAEAGENAVGGGFGYYRIVSEYCGNRKEQVLRFKPIHNTLMVSLERNKRYGFIREGLAIDEFEEKYGKFNKEEVSDFENPEDDELWYEEDKVFIAEYFERVPYQKTIAETDDGKIIEIDEKDKDNYNWSRTHTDYQVKWYKLCGHKVLERGEWAGDEIPIFEVCGHKLWFKGRVYKKSLIDDAIDMAKALNYWITSATERMALAPRAPWLITKRQIAGYETEWAMSNVENKATLIYNDVPNSPPPQRNFPPDVGQGEMYMINLCYTYIMAILGMFEASVGQSSNERSGKAIQARDAASQSVVFHFPDNLARTRRAAKRALIKLIPKYYDNERVLRLIGNTDSEGNMVPITINKRIEGDLIKENDLSVGEYDIRANNPANPSIRQQAAEAMREALQYAGEGYAPVILPEFFRNLDVPGMKELSQKIDEQTQKMEQQKQLEATGGLPQL